MSPTQALEQLLDQAVEIALRGEYDQAIELYQNILTDFPDHLATNLALAYAHLQNKQIQESEQIYKKILSDFPGHTIANNQLNKIQLLKKNPTENLTGDKQNTINNLEFVQIPGKTRVISLATLGQLSVLLSLQIGQNVTIQLKKRHVEIRTPGGEYIGVLPDDLSHKLFALIQNGNQYEAFVKFASKNEVEIFMREIFQSEANHGIISFTRSIVEHRLPDTKTDSDSSEDPEVNENKKTDEEDEDENQEDEEEEEPELLDQLAEKLTEDEAELSSYADGDDFVGNDE